MDQIAGNTLLADERRQLEAEPTAPAQRLETLDVLRGFMLCAILLMNIELFTVSIRDTDAGISSELEGFDWIADAVIYTLLHGKGWTLFALLFGVGFAVMCERTASQNRPLVVTWLRRAGVLFVIGVLHATLVWSGDILVTYSLVAVALLLFRNTSPRRAALLGAACFGLPVLLGVASAAVAMGMPVGQVDHGTIVGLMDRAAEEAALSSGTFAEASAERWGFLVASVGQRVLFLPLVLGMALLGVALHGSGALSRPAAHTALWWRLLVSCGVAGAVVTATSLVLDPNPVFIGVVAEGRTYMAATLHLLGAPLLAVAYAAAVVLATLEQRAGVRLALLAPAGRLALSNYLLQSIVCTWIFYGYGLGMWGEVSRIHQVHLALAILVFQVFASRWYVRRFRYGPAEWLWRWATYGRRPAFKVAPALAPVGTAVARCEVDPRETHALGTMHSQLMRARSGAGL